MNNSNIKTSHSYQFLNPCNWHERPIYYNCWDDFKKSWFMGRDNKNYDDDYNFIFRYDIEPQGTLGDKPFETEIYYCVNLQVLQQRKGRYIGVFIKNVPKEDIIEVKEFLKERRKYIFNLWEDI